MQSHIWSGGRERSYGRLHRQQAYGTTAYALETICGQYTGVGSGRPALGRESRTGAPTRTSTQRPSMRTRLMRLDAPLLMETADRAQPKYWATKAMSSSLALPSTGADLSCARHTPRLVSARELRRARGFALTWMIVAIPIRAPRRELTALHSGSRRDHLSLTRLHMCFDGGVENPSPPRGSLLTTSLTHERELVARESVGRGCAPWLSRTPLRVAPRFP